APLPVDEATLASLRVRLADRPLLLAASTHPGEDEMILDDFNEIDDDTLLVIVPRHPERGAAIARRAVELGFRVARRAADEEPGDAEVYVADTLGELGLWFRLARLAVIGGSLIPGIGGHNPLEPARLNCPMISGPHVENWLTAYADLGLVDGVTLADQAVLGRRLAGLMASPETLRAQADRAQAFVARRDAEARTALDRIIALLDAEPPMETGA
ncbi:MAG: 3-deoxy-D-manno-octulosonic acid transferase, partial [Caulobacter sp.]|nr:3-deoxy-D-manno-octulosonic acid transferase [Caulobacter sp.]